MGVHGLWELLAPVGRRVSVETLAGKKLAIDASIWMVQFMKAMRDEKGEMVRNAHILGFFRRICKLLYLRTKPVFVFDGGTPALKRRTVIARRRQRENAQTKIRKTAEKLLLNHLKTMRLKELAADLEKQRQEGDRKGKRPIIEESCNDQETQKGNTDASINYNQEKLDEMLAASIAAEENEGFNIAASSSGADIPNDEDYDDDDDDDDEDEEMILPEMNGKVDPAVLASLPPSMQLDLLVQMRERLMAENRQKYQKVKKAPARFSELQIESYLKTVAFRREIDVVQKAAAGRGIGGVQTSRIASEANREFIFSSSFTGDKQALASVGQERNESSQAEGPPANSPAKAPPTKSPAKAPSENSYANVFNNIDWPKRPDAATGPTSTEIGKEHDEVETYVDERGRRRLSKVRALGIRMTRDLQRNLDLMKEIDLEKLEKDLGKSNVFATASEIEGVLDELDETTDKNSDGMSNEVGKIEISFEDTYDDNDDKLFARLVAGDSLDFSVDNSAILKEPSHSDSDNDWEEGFVDSKNIEHVHEEGMSDEEEIEWEEEGDKTVTKGAMEEEAAFQEAFITSLEDTSGTVNAFNENDTSEKAKETVTKGALEEEAAFQEAIRRSLDDKSGPMDGFHESYTSEKGKETVDNEEDLQDIVLKPSSCPDKSQSPVAKGALEEEAAFQEAIRRSLDETSGPMDGFHENYTSERGKETVNDEEDFGDIVLEPSSCPDKSQSPVAKGALEEEEAAFLEAVGSVVDFHENNQSERAREAVKKSDCVPIPEGKEQPNVDGAEEFEKDKIDFSNSNEQEIGEELTFLDKEREELGSEQRKYERDAESVSGEMFAECQELLQMFGLPYIIAPMEAEAQCAFMELSNLVDGVVTDDSDAFLFGAQSVYKNIFDDRKYVETYLMKDIETEIGLDREKLIRMALLLGSDYTEGISGIGIVNAIEVVNAFPGKEGLREFREWIESPDPSIFGNFNVETGNNSRKKGPNSNVDGTSDQNVNDIAQRKKQIFMDKHRNVSKNWHISTSFPSDAVISAYDSPQVDKSTEPFAWGKPDLFVLRRLCWEKFAWGASKADELLVPVLKEYNKHETQLRMEAFYTFNERFAKIRSKRIEKAVKGITGSKSSSVSIDGTPQQSGSGRKRKAKPSEDEAKVNTVEKPGGKQQSKRGRTKVKKSNINLEQSRDDSSARGRQGRGRGRGGRGKRKAEITIDDTDEDVQHISEDAHQTRRSGRVRKTVDYTVSDDEKDETFVKGVGSGIDEHIESQVRVDNVMGMEDGLLVDETSKIETRAAVEDDQMEEYLHSGGGFCLNEEEQEKKLNEQVMVEETTNQMDDPSNNEYLQFGGGFCLNEEDQDKEELNENPNELNVHDDDDDDDDVGPKENFLRAMPNLRRKKKKREN